MRMGKRRGRKRRRSREKGEEGREEEERGEKRERDHDECMVPLPLLDDNCKMLYLQQQVLLHVRTALL